MAGRGVDILLGGNPEGLARQEVLKEGFPAEVMADDFTLPLPRRPRCPRSSRRPAPRRSPATTNCSPSSTESCLEEGNQVRELGGLYVIGSERHESRRIDNQLRGRSGRQGDPGESRFYLSLDDELMRLFATGALQLGDGALRRGRGDRGEDGHQGHRTRPDHRRDEERRDPQERPQVRRGDERAAQGDLPAPRSDPRRRGPQGGGDGVSRRCRRLVDRDALRSRSPTTSGTSTGWPRSSPASGRPRSTWPSSPTAATPTRCTTS